MDAQDGPKTPGPRPGSLAKRRLLFESQAEDVEEIDVDAEPDGDGDEQDQEGAWSDPGPEDVPDEMDPHEAYEEERAYHSGRRKRAPSSAGIPYGGGDLAEFFGDIDIPQQISICRAYASYLAAQSRARKPGFPGHYIKRRK